MENFIFAPSTHLTVSFVTLSLVVTAAAVGLSVWAAHKRPELSARRWAFLGSGAAVVWMLGHAALAHSGVLVGETMPPPVLPYLVMIMVIGVTLALSKIGGAMATALPLAALVGLQSFRVPLEWLLHELYREGALPIQMTWSGLNWDVITGVSALVLALAALRYEIPRWMYWVWNVVGFVLLVNVVTIALLSAPLPIRQFTEGPPVVLVFHAPYTWIVSVHVFTALVGHIVVFRALLQERKDSVTT